MRIEPTLARQKIVERMLMADIKWTITKGPGFDPGVGAERKKTGWRPRSGSCGVCAIAATLLHRDANYRGPIKDDVNRAAKVLLVNECWVEDIYGAISHENSGASYYIPSAFALTRRLLKYAKQVRKEHNAKKKLLKAKTK